MFGGIFGSITPRYEGSVQPAAQSRNGLFGLITGMFAPSAPIYVRPQPEPAVPPSIAPASPSSGEVAPPSDTEDGPNGEPEPQGKHITIIVKPGPGTSVEEVVQFLRDRCLDH